jgi:hypothetical protein
MVVSVCRVVLSLSREYSQGESCIWCVHTVHVCAHVGLGRVKFHVGRNVAIVIATAVGYPNTLRVDLSWFKAKIPGATRG